MATIERAPVGVPNMSVEELIGRAGTLKAELVTFVQGPRFERRLTARLIDAADEDGCLDEGSAIRVIDQFALQHTLSNGRTVLESFVAQRRPPLTGDERAMVLGWHDVVDSVFEVRQFDGDAVELHNLTDDLGYRVYSNLGRGALATLRKRTFVAARIVPVHPGTDAWLLSGYYDCYPRSAGPEIAKAAAQLLAANPGQLRRNPEMLRRAREIQAEHRAGFIEHFGSDLVILPPGEAQEKLREYYHRQTEKAMRNGADGLAGNGWANRVRKAIKRGDSAGPDPAELIALPADLLDADTVGLIYDECEGLNFCRDFGRLDELFADPSLARDRGYLNQLRVYLDDDSVSPLAIRRLARRHPDGADQVFRVLLRKPRFSWARDGEDLLRRRKKVHFDKEPGAGVIVLGTRLVELLGGGR